MTVKDQGICPMDAICVHGAEKSYGLGKYREMVLCKLDMNIKKGVIYGLLGPSGCGKTTFLSCLVGRQNLDSGEILVFGGKPGSPDSGVPGHGVGYMPQELALYPEMTIDETLEYFGHIYNLKQSFINSQMDRIYQLLDLPRGKQYVRTLSGGQQRRVSFATAIFHEPQLLILDEPTVGVDSQLRQRIWNHLSNLSNEHGKTIIITTHYIEEARLAGTVGFMRCGRLLAEDSPQALLNMYGSPTLEGVFLKLCTANTKPGPCDTLGLEILETKTIDNALSNYDCSRPRSEIRPLKTGADKELNAGFANISNLTDYVVGKDSTDNVFPISEAPDNVSITNSTSKFRSTTMANSRCVTWHRTLNLVKKNFLRIRRSIGLSLFIALMPVLESVLFCLIFVDPKFLKIGIVNEELETSLANDYDYSNYCNYSMLSRSFLQHLTSDTIVQVNYSNFEEAMAATRAGDIWGLVHFRHNFTCQYFLRQEQGADADDDTIISSRIGVHLDMSNQQIAFNLRRHLLNTFDVFSKELIKTYSYQEAAANTPLTFLEPIYGQKEPAYVDFVAPGFIISSIFIGGFAVSGIIFISERKQGVMVRNLVAGVQMVEILLAHFIDQLLFVISHTASLLIVLLGIFKITCNGSIALASCLLMLQSLVGLCFGIVISMVFDDELAALQFSLALLFTSVILGGVLWPQEGMPSYVRYASYALPQTPAIQSLRDIFARGHGLDRPEVYLGFITSSCWIIAILFFCGILLRIRKHSG